MRETVSMLAKIKKQIGIANVLLLVVIAFLWISVLWVQGLAGAFSWMLLKLAMPIAGFGVVVAYGIALIIFAVKRKKMIRLAISVLLGLAMMFPILMTINAIPFAYPARLGDTSPSLTIASPFKVDAVIGWGGNTLEENLPHAMWASEQWAYDIMMPPFDTGSTYLNDYGIWDKEVFSPVEGTVVESYDGEDDIPPNTEEFISAEGNHVYIRVKETGTYLLLNHLKKDSVAVNAGDEIKVGDFIGKVGNSGSTSEPHLHIHHQRQNPAGAWFLVAAEGLPLYFDTASGFRMPVKDELLKPWSEP